jgi:hypothetical protein
VAGCSELSSINCGEFDSPSLSVTVSVTISFSIPTLLSGISEATASWIGLNYYITRSDSSALEPSGFVTQNGASSCI